MKYFYSLLSVAFLAVFGYAFYSCSSVNASDESIPEVVDYNFHIRPILSDRCFKCHGPDAKKREANLRLDTPEGAYAAFKDNLKAHAIVPGKPNESDAFLRLITKDTSLKMPPVKSNLTLTQHSFQVHCSVLLFLLILFYKYQSS